MKRLISSLFILFIISCSEEPIIYTLTATANPVEGGSVFPSSQQYDSGDIAAITATPSSEYIFQNWSGSASGTSPSTTVTMNSDKSVVANFIKKKYALTLNVEGEGSITQKVIKAGVARNDDYTSGTILELTANPEGEWLFVEWKGDLTGNENPKQITIDKAKTVTAVFIKKQYPLTIEVEGLGSVIEKVIKAGVARNDYNSGTILELTANGQTGWNFVEWQGDLTGNDNPKQITIDKAKTVKAVFQEEEKVKVKFNMLIEDGLFYDSPYSDYQYTTTNGGGGDSIAHVNFELKDPWGQGWGIQRLVERTNRGTALVLQDKEFETYKNSTLKVTVTYPHRQYAEITDWGDDVDSDEQSIEIQVTRDLRIEPHLKSIKVNIFDLELRKKLANTGVGPNVGQEGTFFNQPGPNKRPIIKKVEFNTPKVPMVNFWNINNIAFTEQNPLAANEGVIMQHMVDLYHIFLTPQVIGRAGQGPISSNDCNNQWSQNKTYGCLTDQWLLNNVIDFNDFYTDFEGNKDLFSLTIGSLNSLNISNSENLEVLAVVNSSNLNDLDVNNNPQLKYLGLSKTNINKLNFNSNSDLRHIKLYNSPISEIKLPENENHKEYFKTLVFDGIDLSSFNFDGYSGVIEEFHLYNLSNLKSSSLELSNINLIKSFRLQNIPLESLDLSNNIRIQGIVIKDMTALKSINFTETNKTLNLSLTNTNIESLDLKPLRDLVTLQIWDDNTIDVVDISNNTDINRVSLKRLNNLKCLIVSQYHIDNQANIHWELPDGIEIKLNCN